MPDDNGPLLSRFGDSANPLSDWQVRRALLFAAACLVGLGALTVRLLLSHQWLGAGVAASCVVVPFLVGAVMWRNHRLAALEEARRVRHPLDLP